MRALENKMRSVRQYLGGGISTLPRKLPPICSPSSKWWTSATAPGIQANRAPQGVLAAWRIPGAGTPTAMADPRRRANAPFNIYWRQQTWSRPKRARTRTRVASSPPRPEMPDVEKYWSLSFHPSRIRPGAGLAVGYWRQNQRNDRTQECASGCFTFKSLLAEHQMNGPNAPAWDDSARRLPCSG